MILKELSENLKGFPEDSEIHIDAWNRRAGALYIIPQEAPRAVILIPRLGYHEAEELITKKRDVSKGGR